MLIMAGLVAALALVLSNLQHGLIRVSAQVVPITINYDHLAFGPVYSGEELYKNFTVLYSDHEEAAVFYRIAEKIKPRPDAEPPDGYDGTASAYCQENPADYARCYRDLCPFITKISREEEGDEESGASVGPDDQADVWYVRLDVPAVIGAVAQDHGGGIVNETGEYGCDIAVEPLPV